MMQCITRIPAPRLMKPLLLLGFGLLAVSQVSHARTLKVGDEYAGGVIIYLFPSGEESFKQNVEEHVKMNISEQLYKPDSKEASDKFDTPSFHDGMVPDGLPPRSVAGIEAIESNTQNGSW